MSTSIHSQSTEERSQSAMSTNVLIIHWVWGYGEQEEHLHVLPRIPFSEERSQSALSTLVLIIRWELGYREQ